MTIYVFAPALTMYDSYKGARSGPAAKCTFIADSTTLATVVGSGHVIVAVTGCRSRADAGVIDTQIRSMVDSGRASSRSDPVVG